jgi:hypothetical protein
MLLFVLLPAGGVTIALIGGRPDILTGVTLRFTLAAGAARLKVTDLLDLFSVLSSLVIVASGASLGWSELAAFLVLFLLLVFPFDRGTEDLELSRPVDF